MELLLALPGTFLAVLFALIDRSFEIRGIAESDRKVPVEALYIAIMFCVLGTLWISYLTLALGLLTTTGLVTVSIATLVSLVLLTQSGIATWVARKLIPTLKKPVDP